MIKKIISIVLVVCLVLSLSIYSFADTFTSYTYINPYVAFSDQTGQGVFTAMAADFSQATVPVAPSGLPALTVFSSVASLVQAGIVIGQTFSRLKDRFNTYYNLTDYSSSFSDGDSFKFQKSGCSLTIFDFHEDQYGFRFYPFHYDSAVANTLGTGTSPITCNKVYASEKAYYLEFTNPYNNYVGCYLLFDRVSEVLETSFVKMDTSVGGLVTAVDPVSTPIGSILTSAMLTRAYDLQQVQLANQDILIKQNETLAQQLAEIKAFQATPAVNTSTPSVNGDWMTYRQGNLLLSDTTSIINVLNSISTNNANQVQLLNSAVDYLNQISYYLPQISSQLAIISQNQINFFQSTEARLLRIEQELTGLSLEPGRLFPLTLESVGFIKAFIALIFGIFIAIFHFLGMFVAVAPDYLFFVPQGLMPFVMALPFLALFMVFLHWVRG